MSGAASSRTSIRRTKATKYFPPSPASSTRRAWRFIPTGRFRRRPSGGTRACCASSSACRARPARVRPLIASTRRTRTISRASTPSTTRRRRACIRRMAGGPRSGATSLATGARNCSASRTTIPSCASTPRNLSRPTASTRSCTTRSIAARPRRRATCRRATWIIIWATA